MVLAMTDQTDTAESDAFAEWDAAEVAAAEAWRSYVAAWERAKAAEDSWRRVSRCDRCGGRGRLADHPCACQETTP
jgi:ferric-dicitrate binding protein FerR (iron transport regulator)